MLFMDYARDGRRVLASNEAQWNRAVGNGCSIYNFIVSVSSSQWLLLAVLLVFTLAILMEHIKNENNTGAFL